MRLPRIHRPYKGINQSKITMKTQQRTPKSLRLLLMPLMAFVFFIGFIASLYGERKENSQIRNRAMTTNEKPQAYDFEMRLIPKEEEQTINSVQ